MSHLYQFTLPDAAGRDISLADYRGKVLLIVNTATRCGLTPQYSELQQLYAAYRDQGFEVLDFPCNQFREQAPEDAGEIAQTCQLKFGTEFTIFDKIEVNGSSEHPLYTWLKAEQPEDTGGSAFKELLLKLASIGEKREGSDIKWNFTKFLVNRRGEVIARYSPSVKPSELTGAIEQLLAQPE